MLMNEVLGDFKDVFVIVYLDDILIYNHTKREHLQHLRQIFQRLREHKLFLKLEFLQEKVKFLGHIITKEGIQADSSMIKTISQWRVPGSVKELRMFLVVASWLRKFIRNFAHIAAPLTRLLGNKATRAWGASQQQAFQTLKDHNSAAPVWPSMMKKLRWRFRPRRSIPQWAEF